jgi:hypothetical protein
VTTVTAGIGYAYGSVYDGNNVWITDGTLRKLNGSGAVVQTVSVGSFPYHLDLRREQFHLGPQFQRRLRQRRAGFQWSGPADPDRQTS